MDPNKSKPYSYADYQRLREHSSDAWNKEDLAKFLVLDYFDRLSADNLNVENIKKDSLVTVRALVKKYAHSKKIFYLFDALFSKLYQKREKHPSKKRILFQNAKYSDLIIETAKHHSVGLLAQGKKDRMFAIKHFLGYVHVDDLEEYLYRYLDTNDETYLYDMVNAAENKLRAAKPDYIVLRDDYGPVCRAIILASRRLGITTFVIQHGIYDLSFSLSNDIAADYALTWGKYFKDLFVMQGARKSHDIYVLGYPYIIRTKKVSKRDSGRKTVCYLGQDYERYDKDLLKIKLQSLAKIRDICDQLGMDFLYRPHPNDDRNFLTSVLPHIVFTGPKEKLADTFNRADIFISFSSTALIEASMRNKLSLQLMNYFIKSDNFEQLGICEKSFRDINELQAYLSNIADAVGNPVTRFNNDYIETRYNPGVRLVEIIEEIEKKN